jgi:molybdate transport system substrate-binding protein
MKLTKWAAALVMLLKLCFPAAEASQTNVAVAANFTEPSKEIAALFKQKTGHDAILSFGASGLFLDQIRHDAPFQVFLSADAGRPKPQLMEATRFRAPSSPMPLASSCCGARSSM